MMESQDGGDSFCETGENGRWKRNHDEICLLINQTSGWTHTCMYLFEWYARPRLEEAPAQITGKKCLVDDIVNNIVYCIVDVFGRLCFAHVL